MLFVARCCAPCWVLTMGVQINFLSMDDAEVEGTKSNLLRTLGAAAT